MNIALQNQWLTENSVLYALLTDTLPSLKRQEEEFLWDANLTKSNQELHPVTTWCYGARINANKTLRSVHFGVVVVELINCKCGGIVRNQIW